MTEEGIKLEVSEPKTLELETVIDDYQGSTAPPTMLPSIISVRNPVYVFCMSANQESPLVNRSMTNRRIRMNWKRWFMSTSIR
jgi:hypothetical protein